MSYLSDNDLLPDRQSAYRAFRSTETVMARVLSDILTALDTGDIAALTLLNLSAAFDTVVDHVTLLQTSYGLDGTEVYALACMVLFVLPQRHQHITSRPQFAAISRRVRSAAVASSTAFSVTAQVFCTAQQKEGLGRNPQWGPRTKPRSPRMGTKYHPKNLTKNRKWKLPL